MKKALITTHYSLTTMRTGMVKFVFEIAKSLSSNYEVHILAKRDAQAKETIVEGITIHHGNIKKTSGFHLYLYHPPYLPEYKSKKNVYIIDSAKDIGSECDPSHVFADLVIFSTKNIKEKSNYSGKSIIVHPIVYPEEHQTEKGNKITVIGMSWEKGGKIAYNL